MAHSLAVSNRVIFIVEPCIWVESDFKLGFDLCLNEKPQVQYTLAFDVSESMPAIQQMVCADRRSSQVTVCSSK